jgi:hypothetical protein
MTPRNLALNALLDGLPNLRFDGDQKQQRNERSGGDVLFRRPSHLAVVSDRQ